jgi:hypothetical protein
MNVELLDVIYGASIVLLPATGESSVIVFHWPLRLLISYDHTEEIHSNHIKGERDENESREGTRWKWRIDDTVSHHLRFSYVDRRELEFR